MDDASLDLLPFDGSEPWVCSDLVQNPFQETVDPRRHCEMAVAAVIMGDLMRQAIKAVKAGDWTDLVSSDKLNAWTSAKLRECYSEADHRASRGQGGVTLSNVHIVIGIRWRTSCGGSRQGTATSTRR